MGLMSVFIIERDIRDKWQGKLAETKDVAKKIWAQPFNASFTDHGMKHSERLVNCLETILILASGEDYAGLSESERYSKECRLLKLFTPLNINANSLSGKPNPLQDLLGKIIFTIEAAAYLHDIGMQCSDVSLHEKCDFTLKGKPSSYSNANLSKIREWHNELSALWLEEAFQSSANPALSYSGELKNIISGIDSAIVNTLIDACRYHSKKPLTEIPATHAFDEGIVKSKVIALLIRLVDELDINRNRVVMAELEHLKLKKESEYWWWYHYLIKCISVESSGIKFCTNFNVQDRDIAEKTTKLFAEDFLRKNGKVLGLLSEAGIKLNVNPYHQPTPEIDNFAVPIPKRVKEKIKKTIGRST